MDRKRRKLLGAAATGTAASLSGCITAAVRETEFAAGLIDRNCPPDYVKNDEFNVTPQEGYLIEGKEFYAQPQNDGIIVLDDENRSELEPGDTFRISEALTGAVHESEGETYFTTSEETDYCEIRKSG